MAAQFVRLLWRYPVIPLLVILLLCLAFLRVDPKALRAQFGRPQLLLAATVWTMMIVPVLIAVQFSFNSGRSQVSMSRAEPASSPNSAPAGT